MSVKESKCKINNIQGVKDVSMKEANAHSKILVYYCILYKYNNQ